MSKFGDLLRIHRQQCRDPLRGGVLSQDRLGELLGLELGDRGYSGAAVSYWEGNKSKISEDDRLVLVSLIAVLHKNGGLHSLEEANNLLNAGNYRDLDPGEASVVFSDSIPAVAAVADSIASEGDQTATEKSVAYQTSLEDRSRESDGTKVSSPVSQRRRKQLILLDKVDKFWVEGVLEHSIRDVTLIDLKWKSLDDAIEQPWRDVMRSGEYSGQDMSKVTAVGRLFEESEHALLILGDPGAGKTTVLLLLAKDLSDRARQDETQPIPVVLNLVSWERSRRSLADWVVSELTAKYLIPRQLGRKWLENDQLILLLDGLDEIRERRSGVCAEAINHFREHQGLTEIAVCSRTEGYAANSTRLKLGAAVLLEPLTTEQIDRCLASAGNRLSTLRKVVSKDKSLREMARSPLMLSVMGAVFSDVSGIRVDDDKDDAPAVFVHDEVSRIRELDITKRRQLFDAYVKKMFQRYGGDPAYPPKRTENYLGWLARKLPQQNTSIFLIEQMQPSWLPTLRWRTIYILSHGLIVGFVAGIILWLLLTILNLRNSPLTTGLFRPVAEYVGIQQTGGIFLILVAGNLFLGLISGAISGYHMEWFDQHELDDADERRLKWRRISLTGAAVGILTIISLISLGEPQLVIAWSFAEVVVYVIVARYVHGQSFENDIRIVESLGWSWHHAREGLIAGLLLGITTEVIGAIVAPRDLSGITTIVFAAGGLILGGMRGRRVEEKSRPNQGILLSIRNAVVAALLMGLVLGAFMLISYDWRAGVLTALISALIVFSLFGGSTLTKHLLLHLSLRYLGFTPWRFSRFLDHASRLVFLRKVGGGYIFTHRSLQEHFASSYPARPDQPAQDATAPGIRLQDTLPDAQA